MDVLRAMAIIAAYVTSAGYIVKVMIDLAKAAYDPPRWLAPTAAVPLGILVVALLMAVQALPLEPRNVAIAVIAGVLAAGAAILGTRLQEAEKGGPAERLKQDQDRRP